MTKPAMKEAVRDPLTFSVIEPSLFVEVVAKQGSRGFDAIMM